MDLSGLHKKNRCSKSSQRATRSLFPPCLTVKYSAMFNQDNDQQSPKGQAKLFKARTLAEA